MDDFLTALNPYTYFTPEQYTQLWRGFSESLFSGFWSRFISLALIALAFYLGVRRQRYFLGILCVTVAAILVYGGSFLKYLGLM